MTFYRFVALGDLPELRERLAEAAAELGLEGTIVLAEEGINATLAGERTALEAFRDRLCRHRPLAAMPVQFSAAATAPFRRLKVRIRPEIVSLGRPAIDPARRTGEHVDAVRWNALLADPEVLVLDARNAYEVAVGTFPGALDPGTRSFRELPDYLREHRDPARDRRVAMFCTGGIRCEKASAWMLDQGFESVYQLQGGILGYLQTVAADDNRWQGECFVFDQRGSLQVRPAPAPPSGAPARR